MRAALITGVAGTALAPREVAYLKEVRPAGLILFARNLQSHAQIRALIDAVRDVVDSDELLVLIDQEGGRVQRLRPPLGRALPPAAAFVSWAGVCGTGPCCACALIDESPEPPAAVATAALVVETKSLRRFIRSLPQLCNAETAAPTLNFSIGVVQIVFRPRDNAALRRVVDFDHHLVNRPGEAKGRRIGVTDWRSGVAANE